MTTLTPTQFIAFSRELGASKVPVESVSYQMTGGRFTRLAIRTGKGKKTDYVFIRAEQFDDYVFMLEPDAFY